MNTNPNTGITWLAAGETLLPGLACVFEQALLFAAEDAQHFLGALAGETVGEHQFGSHGSRLKSRIWARLARRALTFIDVDGRTLSNIRVLRPIIAGRL